MLSFSHWGMHKVDVAGTDNFRESLKRSYSAHANAIQNGTMAGNWTGSSNALASWPQSAQQYQAAAHKWD